MEDTRSTSFRELALNAARQHAKAHVEKHRINVEVYLTQPVGIGGHSNIMEAIEHEIDEMAKYHDQLEIIETYFTRKQ